MSFAVSDGSIAPVRIDLSLRYQTAHFRPFAAIWRRKPRRTRGHFAWFGSASSGKAPHSSRIMLYLTTIDPFPSVPCWWIA